MSTPVAKPGAASVLDEGAWCSLCDRLNLSPRELQIARGIFADHKEGKIAADLGLSAHTVRTHLERLYRKLRVHSRVELVLHLMEQFLRLTREPGSPLPPICAAHASGSCPLHH